MMFPPDFTPIELRGMSIITAIVISFLAMAGIFCYTQINKRLDNNDEVLEKYQFDIAEMKTNIALTLQSVTRMERILERQKED